MELLIHSQISTIVPKIIIVYCTHTNALSMRACYRGPAFSPTSVRGSQHRTGPGPVLKSWSPHAWHEKSNNDKTTLVAFLPSLLLGGNTFGSIKLALADIFTRSMSTECQELSWLRLSRRWWHCRLSTVATEWHRGGSLFFNVLIIY